MKYMIYMPLLFLAACGSSKKEETPAAPAADGRILVLTPAQMRQAEPVSEIPPVRTGSNTIAAKGQIEAPPQNRISVTSPLGGYVRQIGPHIGDRVKKGETLAVLEDLQLIQLQQDYLSGKSRLVQLQAEYERQTALGKTQASSLKQAELAKADFENQQVAQKAGAEKLRLIGIDPERLTVADIRSSLPVKSTVDGFVTAIYANIGKYVSGAEVLMDLVDPSDIHLSLHVFEQDLPALRIGRPVQAYTNSDPGKTYPAEIARIGKTVSADKSVEVHCHFRSVPPELIPGLYMNARIEIEGSPAGAIPEDALIDENGTYSVFVTEGGNRFSLLPVRVAWTQNDSVGITGMDGNRPARPVVVKNAYPLYMEWKNRAD